MAVHINSASIAGITTDSGSSSTDFYTNDQTLVVSGTATVTGGGTAATLGVWAVSGTGPTATYTYLGDVSVSASGAWTFSTASSSLPQGSYTLQVYESTSTANSNPGGTILASQALTIDTTAPTETLPGTQTDPLSGGGTVIFGSLHGNQISVADNNTDTLSAVFKVTDGTLHVAGTASGITIAGNSTGTLTISGTAAAINNFINNNLTYTTLSTNTVVGNTDDTLTVTTTDQAGNVSSASSISIDVTCFMGGTMIHTPDGQIAVECLKAGDLVLTEDGRALPVRWIGRQTVSTIFGDMLRVLPIRIKAGAFSENVPSRDLLVSPDHAILINGILAQAAALVNETSIVRETAVPRIFTYYHVELDRHSLIIAENTPVETFVDNVDRLRFDNWEEHQALYPEGKAIAELPYPRAKSRRQVPVYIRVMLAERAGIIGVANEAAVA
jgi:hypothetical protein